MSKNTLQSSAKPKILDAALCVIREKGYAATTVDELCAAAGVTKGAFFHHFKSKEALGVAAAEYWSAVTTEFFANAPFRKLQDPLERVFGYIDFRREILQGKISEYTCLLGTMVQETFDTSPAIRDACQKTIFAHAAVVAADIEAAKKIHAPEARWGADSLALHMQCVLQGSFILAKADNGSAIAADSILHLRRYVEFLFSPTTLKEGKS